MLNRRVIFILLSLIASFPAAGLAAPPSPRGRTILEPFDYSRLNTLSGAAAAYRVTGLPPGRHTIRLTVLEEKNPASRDRYVNIIGVDVVASPAGSPTSSPVSAPAR